MLTIVDSVLGAIPKRHNAGMIALGLPVEQHSLIIVEPVWTARPDFLLVLKIAWEFGGAVPITTNAIPALPVQPG